MLGLSKHERAGTYYFRLDALRASSPWMVLEEFNRIEMRRGWRRGRQEGRGGFVEEAL